ncbi:hypothetical protein QQF64_022097 [Cirrhinus molitorella]|uniref:Uncharacterized protein n=1 Tax=Cirrhinus molitorella TaxID=172907 RepID=A0ABR3L771_9TELE
MQRSRLTERTCSVKYETEGRARLKEGGFLGPEDQSVSVGLCVFVCLRERERERESKGECPSPLSSSTPDASSRDVQ